MKNYVVNERGNFEMSDFPLQFDSNLWIASTLQKLLAKLVVARVLFVHLTRIWQYILWRG